MVGRGGRRENLMELGLISFVLDMFGKLRGLGKWLRTRRFRQVFGEDSNKKFYVIYSVYRSPSRGIIFPKPKPEVVRRRACGGTNLSTVNSCATTRAVGHLVYGFGENVKIAPIILSDKDTDEDMELSFISIGGITNFKTVDLLENSSNKFLDYEKGSIIAKGSRRALVRAGKESGFDHGFIIKVNPSNNMRRTWICCGGVAEWGTSGAAWYLVHRWKEIRKFAKGKPFACITKTRVGSDDSTEAIYKFLSGGEVKSATEVISQSESMVGKDVETAGTVNERKLKS